MAHALGLRSIAEGVETNEQLALLREMGCDFAKGYLLSRPADMEAFTAWLDACARAEVVSVEVQTSVAVSRKRGGTADRREVKADVRDAQADTRETKANARDETASTRDEQANDRDTEANNRDTEANSRDLTAANRDVEANTRDAAADSRDANADLRDSAASDREHVEDDRETEHGREGHAVGGESSSARHTARQDRNRATAVRLVEVSDRAAAGKGRDDASAGRASRANERAKNQADAQREDGEP